MFDISITLVFIGGLTMFFSQCVFPLLPVYFGVLEKDNKKIRNTVLFLLGISFSFVILGFGFGLLGDLISSEIVRIMAGIIIIILGLQQLGIFKFVFLQRTKILKLDRRYNNSGVESFMLGLTFSLGWTPCIGPILGGVLLLASESGTALQGAILLLVFVLGFSMPFLMFTMFYDKLRNKITFIKRNLELIKKISAILIIVMGLLLLFDKLEILVAELNRWSI